MTEVEVLRERIRKIGDLIDRPVRVDSLEAEVAEWKQEAANARDQAVSLRLQRDQAESDVRGLRAENDVLRAAAALKVGPTVATAPKMCPDCKGSGKVTHFPYRSALSLGRPCLGACPTCWGVRCPQSTGGGGA